MNRERSGLKFTRCGCQRIVKMPCLQVVNINFFLCLMFTSFQRESPKAAQAEASIGIPDYAVAGTASHVQRSAQEFAAALERAMSVVCRFHRPRQGLIDHQAVRYVLHRMFVQKYGCTAALAARSTSDVDIMVENG